MKPNFALTLSAEGVRLLQRAPSGWLLVGDADFAAENLTDLLAQLREDAEVLSPGDVRCKLVLPNDQIKYMTVGSTASSEEAAEADAATALDGATPYALSDLAFDWSLDDGQLFLAAVARETLAEAEAFAVEHGFDPVSFVALPEQNDFPGEPFFGVTRAAKALLSPTENVARDLQPLHVIGMAEFPEPEPEPEPEAPMIVDAGLDGSESVAQQSETPDTLDPAEPTEPAESAPAPEPEPEPAPEPEPEPADAPKEDTAELTEAKQQAPAALPPETTSDPQDTAPGMAFASVRASRSAPDGTAKPVGGAETAIESVTAPSIPISATAADTDLSAEFQSSRAPIAAPADKPAQAGTTSKAPKPEKPKPQKSQPSQEAQSERQRLTMFGARKPAKEGPVIGGKPRFMGLALTVILLIFLAVVAIWASFISEDGLAGLFRSDPEQIEVAAVPATPDAALPATPDKDTATAEELAEAQDVEPAGEPDPALSDGQAIVLPDTPDLMSPEEAERRYIATGIWLIAPEQPLVPEALGNADVYLASIDPKVRAVDAVALPDISRLHDAAPNETLNPTVAGTTFDLDERGLVKATPEGALTPEGITVYAGKPAIVPQTLPERRGDGLSAADLERLAQVRPRLRPGNLQEATERGQLGGRTLSELAAIRPKARPGTVRPQTDPDEADTATPQAVALSLRPKTRPKNFDKLVAQTKKAEPTVRTAAAAAPSIPSSASVARQATVKNALNLRKLNLIGVNGKGGDRRALVRTSGGRYKTVKVGDRLDGGKVAVITESELRYVKNGKSVVLKMPRG
jgi:hypothetical protein